MKENKKETQKQTSKSKYRAVNPEQFKEWFTSAKPKYKELCDGSSVELDESNSSVKSWISNKIIIKEN